MFPDGELPKEAFAQAASGDTMLLMKGPFTEMGVPRQLEELTRGAYTVGGVQGQAAVAPETDGVEEGNMGQTEAKNLSPVAEVEEEEDLADGAIPAAEKGEEKPRNMGSKKKEWDSKYGEDTRGGWRGRGQRRGACGRGRSKRGGGADTAFETTDTAGKKN